ncbi:hypothetical protein QMK19_40495 [Streptomyces sp. H10-C2]|uniref:hypothetical protein n=1 Tax=unclassified Streptomyces TaxID=2593676 RepID=UPI0024BA0923|nr:MULTISPECIES: hypothetical protein [unclassified Streptomyces]MDJ0347409.1 hypothetical protein [Streptomyces sp. PH10-H1]MDJ0375688.1 hypothetical protein [Streptomyces sp. H10-C2]
MTDPTTAPTLNPQIIGQVENAHKALMARVLAGTGTTFFHWVALKLTAVSGGAIDRDQLVGRIAGALKIEDAAALAAIAELDGAQLLRTEPGEGFRVALTDSGQARYRRFSTAVDEIMARVYSDISEGDLATAARVLTLITARANAELAAA